jgi:hypothetical protein
MKMSIKKTFGKNPYNFQVEGKNLYELAAEAQKLSFPDHIEKCGICGSDDLYLNSRFAQNKYKYVEIKCKKCKAQLVFGCTKENPDVFYLRKDKQTKEFDWKEYTPDEGNKVNE